MNLLVNPVSLNQLQTKAIGDNLGNSEESRNNTLLLFFFFWQSDTGAKRYFIST